MIQTNNLQKMDIEIVQAPDGSSLYIDISLPAALARATIGRLGTDQGYCDTEILDIATEETTYWHHQEFGSSTDLAAELTAFFGKLRDLPASANAPTFSFELPLADKSVSLNALLEPLLAVAAGH
jgi:hypothetical protein